MGPSPVMKYNLRGFSFEIFLAFCVNLVSVCWGLEGFGKKEQEFYEVHEQSFFAMILTSSTGSH